MEPPGRTFALAILLEAGLGFIGLGIAWLARFSLADQLELSRSGIVRGLLATLPMLLMLGIMVVSTWRPLVEIRKHVERLVSELFAHSNWLEIALISLAAGVGEEILFRGALQPWIASWTHPLIALAVVSLLFGLAHAVTTSYFLIATLIGGYLGWLAMAFDDLVAPMVAHTLYDFIALLYVKRNINHNSP